MTIKLHERTGAFYVDLPHIRADSLRRMGWEITKSGKRIFTKDVDLVLPNADLLDPDLRAAFGMHSRMPISIPEEEWRRIVPSGEQLFEHQAREVEFTLGTGGSPHATIIGGPPGAGKTSTTTVITNALDPRLWLIVCPSSVKYNWETEIRRWSMPDRNALLHIEVCENATAWQHMSRMWNLMQSGTHRLAMILNYDILNTFEQFIAEKPWSVVTYDESHKLKNLEAARTRFCIGPEARIHTDKTLFLSGTKMNRPYDLWPAVRFCEPERLGADHDYFVERYCSNGELNPYTRQLTTNFAFNVRELGQLLGESCFIRHDIDHLLPPYREETVFLPPSADLAATEIALFDEILNADIGEMTEKTKEKYLNLRTFLRSKMAEINAFSIDELQHSDAVRILGETFVEQSELLYGMPVAFEMMTQMRRETGMAKLPNLLEHIKYLLEESDDPDDPLVVMVHHKDVVKAIRDAFPDITRAVYGGVSAKKRRDIVKDFQAGKFPLFVGNIAAAGEGLTLTKSCRLLFGEIDWTATAMWQALKRVHRITQAREVVIQYLLLQNSMDAHIATRYIEKRETINEFFAGAEDARLARN